MSPCAVPVASTGNRSQLPRPARQSCFGAASVYVLPAETPPPLNVAITWAPVAPGNPWSEYGLNTAFATGDFSLRLNLIFTKAPPSALQGEDDAMLPEITKQGPYGDAATGIVAVECLGLGT